MANTVKLQGISGHREGTPTKKLKIGAKLDLRGFMKASFDVTYQQIKEEVENVSD